MSQMLGLLAGTAACFDAMLGILCPQRWMQMWRDIAKALPSPTDEYVADAIDLTEAYQKKSPQGLRAFLLLELGFGLLLLRLGSKE